MSNYILSAIPDFQESAQVEAWATQACASLAQLTNSDAFIPVTTADLDPLDKAAWQKFVNAALLADWACYGAAVDRVDYPRLRDVMSAFPQGFRVWFSRSAGQDFMPVAYTGWYPIATALFDRLCEAPESITHRGAITPLVTEQEIAAPLWLFNYSIVAPLRRTMRSASMLRAYAADIAAACPSGLAAAVISEDSKRVTRRFAMCPVGMMTHMGVSEEVWAMRLNLVPREGED